jgi:hypothetical protein
MSVDLNALTGRPQFFEGQYLSAEDLAAIVQYLRGADARHALAGHTHGIVLGLDLVERNAAGAANRREVILEPGLAWDGFGRTIAVAQPTRLAEALFASIPYAPAVDEPSATGEPPVGRLVKVWLAYAEAEAGSPAPGFESCASDAQYSRVFEGFDFVIGDFTPGPQQRDNVVVGTETVEPQNALTAFEPTAATLYDAAVPHQTFPLNPRQRWLIPVGFVRWVARSGDLGYFIQRDLVAGDNVADRIRAARQYAGLVGEYIQAAGGNLVLHKRGEDPLAANKFASLIASGTNTTEHLGNLAWVEGNLRVGGDAKIAGGTLQLRDVAGLDQGTLLYMGRSGDGAAVAGKRDLNAVIGPVLQKDNRFVVGPHDPAAPFAITPQLAVVSAGRVGVNTGDPVAALDVRGNWDGNENGAVRVAGTLPTVRFGETTGHGNEQWTVQADAAGNLKFSHRTGPPEPAAGSWKSALYLTPTMTGVAGTIEPGVGIRSDHPRNPLAVRAAGPWEELVSFEDAGGATQWHLNQKANATTPGLNFCETGVSDGRLFLKAGGDIGVGTMAPTNKLHVDGNTGIRQNRLYLSGGLAGSSFTYNAHRNGANTGWVFPDPTHKAVTLEMDDIGGATRFSVWSTGVPSNDTWREHFRINGDSDSVVMAWSGGNVGIGTQAPQQKLHVAGSFIRVDGAGNEQAYIGGDGVANDVQLGSMTNGVQNVALYNSASNTRMNLFCRNINCGDIAAGNISGTWVSDLKFKDNVGPIGKPLALLAQLRGVSFNWTEERRRGQADFGVIAQEVQRVLPELVHKGDNGLGVAYISFIPILIEAVKELTDRVDSLRDEVETLRKKAKAAKDEKKEAKPRKGEKTQKGGK